jgi:hypothetical protein
MSFTSNYEVSIAAPLDTVFTAFSTEEMFIKSVKLSSTTASIEILKRDVVNLEADLSYKQGASAPDAEACARLHFRLIEKVKMLGFTSKPEVLGTLIISRKQRLHLYESVANGGLVAVYKIRRFRAQGPNATCISEFITGKTNWLLRSYVAGQCRTAHVNQMNQYETLFPTNATK